MWTRPVCLVNARVMTPGGLAASIRFGHTVLSVGEPPARRDVVVDLDGAFVLPGLVNAHDHLELNHFGAIKGRDRYANASEWIGDMAPRLRSDPDVRAKQAFPLASRLFVGGLKNLLAGVTTVAHHNPRYREMGRRFPVRVVRRYGWAHSFFLEGGRAGARGEAAGLVSARFRATPSDAPFIMHLAEGVDAAAAAELGRLDGMGCLAGNSVLVHGVGLTDADWVRVALRRAALVWCPASNTFLFGRTIDGRMLGEAAHRGARVCLGTDSRLTGSRDLLDELRAAAAVTAPDALLPMVTTTAADVLRLDGAGQLAPGRPADLVVVPASAPDAATSLVRTARRDVAFVAVGGRPMVGAPSFAPAFEARAGAAVRIAVDGSPRIAEPWLAGAIRRSPIAEPGVATA